MKRFFFVSLATAMCLIGCDKVSPVNGRFEKNMQKLFGDYELVEVSSPGVPDLNNDFIGHSDLLYEFQNNLGYFEPDYTACVCDGIYYPSGQKGKSAVAFNVTLPYPYYVVKNGEWICTCIKKINFTIRADEDSFYPGVTCCKASPTYDDPDDVFLSRVREIGLNVQSYDARSFQIVLRCTMPVIDRHELQENYIYYDFLRKNK